MRELDRTDRADASVRIFVSYSHKDPSYLADDSLLGFLRGIASESGVEFWTDERIATGSHWDEEIRKQIERCDIALVLVSQAFLDSAYCTRIEIGSFLDACRKRGLLIFPVVLSPCEWERHEWLATRQFLPGGGETIEEHYRDPGLRKRLFLRIRTELRNAIEGVRRSRAALEAAPAPTPARYAEKRQVTLLCCDLLPCEPDGSPLDPGEAREVLHELAPEFDRACRVLFAKHQGHVVGTGTGGTLVCFGYPDVAEDDSRRAVRAGLELVARVEALSGKFQAALGVALATRAAIHTGSVVIAQEHANAGLSSGETPRAAMVLQQDTAPGTVVISSSTLRLVEPFFEIEKIGCLRGHNGEAPLEYGRVVSDKGFQTRFEAASSRTLTPMVGRKKEIDFLLEQWHKAQSGAGGVVTLRAEAGIGKSRLLAHVRDRIREGPNVWMEWRCSSYHRDSAWHPLVEAVKDALGIAHDASDEEKIARIASVCRKFGAAGERLTPILAPLFAASVKAPASSSQEQKQLTLEACAAFVELFTVRKPSVLVVEDLHWADPTTRELIDLLIAEGPALKLLLLLSFRPEFAPPAQWTAHSHVSHLALSKLDRGEVGEMVLHLTGGKALPAAVSDEIYAKTDGYPLFVEDLTRMVIESDLVRERNGRYELVGPFQSLSIPATLYETIMARLARLATAKPIAQLGATIGREFVYEMLRAVAPVDDESLTLELDRLVAAGLLYRRGLLSKAKYIFKHVLVQEALHASLLKRQRKQYHKLVAEVLEEKFPEAARSDPGLVARHFAEAEIADKAASYSVAAARRALATSGNAEALVHAANALTMLERCPRDDERFRTELAVRCLQGSALAATRGWSSKELGDCYNRARELCERFPGSPHLPQVLRGQCMIHNSSARFVEACAFGEELLRIGRAQGDRILQLQALGSLCSAYFWRGRHRESVRYGMEGLQHYDPAENHLEHVVQFGEDPGASLYAFTAASLAVLGCEAQARALNERAAMALESFTQVYSRGALLSGILLAHLQMRDAERVLELSEELLALANEHRYGAWVDVAILTRAWARTALGNADEGVAQIASGCHRRMTDGHLRSSVYPALLAEAHLSLGEFDQAAEWLRIGFADAGERTEGFALSELWRLRGELLAHTDDTDAEACFLRSLEITREQEALAFELRTESSFCEVLPAGTARRRLEAVMARFTEGFESGDVRRARRMLDRLSAESDS
jgi:tetratricopeptide (TPR) repeat protein